MSKQKKSKEEKNDLSWWKELYPKMMMEKARIAASESILRGKLREKIELGKKLEEFSLKVEEHVNDSEIEGIDLYKVYDEGVLICELIIYDDAEVRELPRSRPQVDSNEISLYYQYIKSQDFEHLFKPLFDDCASDHGGSAASISIEELADFLLEKNSQPKVMEILDNLLNQLYKIN